MQKYKYTDKKTGQVTYGRTDKPLPKKGEKQCVFSSSSSSSSSSGGEEVCPPPQSYPIKIETKLSYAQELVQVPGSMPPRYIPAPNGALNAGRIQGTFEIRFAEDFSSARWKLTVTGATAQNAILAAHLRAGFAYENGPIVVPLFSSTTGSTENPFVRKGTIVNASITPPPLAAVANYNTVASLYAGILRGNVYVNVRSTSLPEGAARGQLFPSLKTY